jgi:hypothetical protein
MNRQSNRSSSTGVRPRYRSRGFGRLLRVEHLENRLLLAGNDVTGNGAPSGPHYSLNIIGTSEKTMNDDIAAGNVIFVLLDGKTKISLVEGEEFAVLDKNGTDQDGATFQLPDPGLDPFDLEDVGDADTVADYSVYVRPLGKPGGFSTITTCADVLESELSDFFSGKDVKVLNMAADLGGVCSIEQVGEEITLRESGKSSFTNVTAELLTVVLQVEIDDDGDGQFDETRTVRVPIFDDILENEYWEYDNDGLRLLQVRFYPLPTDVAPQDALHVAGDPSATVLGEQLTPEMLEQATQQAADFWASADVAGELSNINVRIAQMDGSMLGYAAGSTIWIDDDAAGFGWSASHGAGVDLVKALEHEFGHVLGFGHDEGGVMEPTLEPVVAPTLPPDRISVADLPRRIIKQRELLFSELGQSDASGVLDGRFDKFDLMPLAQNLSELNRSKWGLKPATRG